MDAYDRKARLYPAVCALFPATVLVATAFQPGAWWLSLLTIASVGGLHVFIMQIVRDRGFAAQSRLWAAWGGNPASARLRWSHSELPSQARLHEAVSAATGVSLPSADEESGEPATAEAAYDEAIRVLRTRTRDRERFPLVYSELGNYGFRRNLYALKVVGLIVAGAVGAIAVVLLLSGIDGHHLRWSIPAIAAVGSMLVWIAIVRPVFVKRDAERYAVTLLEAAEELGGSR